MLFVGNIGVNVFQHICKEDGVMTSYFVKTGDDHCENKREIHQHQKSCCSSEKEDKKKDCCNDQTEFFKIDLDFFNDPSISIPTASLVFIPSNYVFVFNETQKEYYTTNYIKPPPSNSGRDILIKHQVFII